MARGAVVKRLLFDSLKEVFGDAYVCEKDNKLYLNLVENGEIVQVAVSATCPKTPLTTSGELAAITPEEVVPNNDFDATEHIDPASEFTKTEEDNISMLLQRLGF